MVWMIMGGVLFGQNEEVLEPISLPQAIEQALQHNFDLASSRIQASLPEVQLAIEKSDFRWKVRPSFAVEQSSDEQSSTRAEGLISKQMTSGALFQVRAEWIGRQEGANDEEVEVRLEQPLFQRFGKLDALRFVDAAEHRLKMARWSFQRETETMVMRVVRTYVDVLRQQSRLTQEIDAVARAADLVRLVSLRKQQGRANEVDLLEMKMVQQEAELRLKRTEEGLNQAKLDLSGLLGMAPEQLPPVEALFDTETPLPLIQEAEEMARENRVERLQAYAEYENARRKLKLQKREFYPDVRLITDYRPVSSQAEEGAWSVGLAAGQQLDQHTKRLEMNRESRNVEAALLKISAFELTLIREVRSAHRAYEVAVAEKALTEGKTRLAAERLRLSQALYPNRITAVQLREAEEEDVQAKRATVEADLRLIQSRYEFWYQVGLLLGDVEEAPDTAGNL
jgi:outer membrane protein TolC